VTVTAPSGWTLQNSTADPGGKVRDVLYWRVAGSSDPTNWTWTFSSSVKASGGIGAYAGVDQTSPVDASAVTTAGSGTALIRPIGDHHQGQCHGGRPLRHPHRHHPSRRPPG
jgi:hypothetical protein